jgi:hypothetical protein
MDEGIVPIRFLLSMEMLVMTEKVHVTPVHPVHTSGEGTPPAHSQPRVSAVFCVNAAAKSHIIAVSAAVPNTSEGVSSSSSGSSKTVSHG